MPDLAATPASGAPRASVVPDALRRPRRLAEIEPRPLVTLASVGLAGLLALAAVAPSPHLWTAAVVLVAGLVVANGWTRVLGLPSRMGTFLVAALGAVATTVSVLLDDGRPPLGWLPAALAVSVVAAFVHQLLRTDGRPRVVASLSGSLLALSLLAAGSCWIAVAAVHHGRTGALAGAGALAAAVVVEHLLAGARRWGAAVVASPLAAAVVGAALAALPGLGLGLGALDAVAGGALGLLAGVVALSVRAVLAPLPQLTARRAQLVSAMTSVLAAGAVVLLVTGWLPA